MSTNSTITLMHDENNLESIYCHWDGYLEWNGQLLYTFYNTAEKVQELMEHGNLSALRMNIGEQIDGRDLSQPYMKNFQCVFYGRDFGDESEQCRKLESISEIDEMEFNYLFNEKDNTWYLLGEGLKDKIPLINALRNERLRCERDGEEYEIFSPNSSLDDNRFLEDICTEEQLERLAVLKKEVFAETYKTKTFKEDIDI